MSISSDFPTRQPAPKIGENGTWLEWDELTQAYVDTGVSAGGGGVTEAVKAALLTIAQKVSYSDTHGQDYYDALYRALYPPAVMTDISVVFSQGSHVVYDSDSLDSLRQYLSVTALYSNGHAETVTRYTLSGVLAEGTSAITVEYNGRRAAFNVTVTHRDVAVTAIAAVFEQGGHTVYDNESLESLRPYLTVTASYGDGTSAEVSSYTLSGTLEVGTSTITASFGGQSDTFTVEVTQHPRVAVSVSATFTQGSNVIYDTASLDSLRQYLVVSVTYDDSTSETVTDYLLGGTLTEGTSTISVYYGTLSTTFAVTVTHYVPETVAINWINGEWNSEQQAFVPNSAAPTKLCTDAIVFDRGNGIDFVFPVDDGTYVTEGSTHTITTIYAFDNEGVYVGWFNPNDMVFHTTEESPSWGSATFGVSYHVPAGYNIQFYGRRPTNVFSSNAKFKNYFNARVSSVTR